MKEPLRHVPLESLYRGDDDRLNGFYIPALKSAARYDRVVGYWRASSLAVAGSGLAQFIRNGGHMRIIAGAEMSDADYAVLQAGRPIEEVVTEVLLRQELETTDDFIAQQYLDILAWMLREKRLEIRIGVALDPEGELLTEQQAKTQVPHEVRDHLRRGWPRC